MISAQTIVNQLIHQNAPYSPKTEGTAFAPVNIALIKYWGKRNNALNLPVTDSLSIGLRTLGTTTSIRLHQGQDIIYLNNERLPFDHPFAQRTSRYLDLFRRQPNDGFMVMTKNDVPTGAGLASSASGYAALVLALNDLFQWQLDKTQLSILARIGSGSACRSLWDGLVHWHAGQQDDGLDSYATPLVYQLPTLRIGLLTLSNKTKPVSSRIGMQQTVHGLSLYPAWKTMVDTHLTQITQAFEKQDINGIGKISEHNALAMHATMLSASPALCYFLPETLATLQTLWSAREAGLNCWATLDAGPNVKLLFEAETAHDVKTLFPDINIIQPFVS
jgi:diphosphomevalonate decarboxylase